jgi:hypothetical protein
VPVGGIVVPRRQGVGVKDHGQAPHFVPLKDLLSVWGDPSRVPLGFPSLHFRSFPQKKQYCFIVWQDSLLTAAQNYYKIEAVPLSRGAADFHSSSLQNEQYDHKKGACHENSLL